MATSPTYGKAQHYLAEQSTVGILRPLDADGSLLGAGVAGGTTIYVSNKISDISMKPGGTSKEFMGTDGQIEGFHVSGEYIDVTFTLIPNSTTRALATLGLTPFRVGTPFCTFGLPALSWYGHVASGSPVITDVLNSSTGAPAAPAADSTPQVTAFYLQSYDFRMSLEGETTGTMTLRRYLNAISPVIIA